MRFWKLPRKSVLRTSLGFIFFTKTAIIDGTGATFFILKICSCHKLLYAFKHMQCSEAGSCNLQKPEMQQPFWGLA